jgi:hypothetical protein
MTCELLVNCIMLIAVVHGLRLLGRRLGPRACGLALGLPSSTALLLVLCGHERGTVCAIEMADADLLGLVAAVAMPVAYAQVVRWGWGLPSALAAAVVAYVAVASALGYLDPGRSVERQSASFLAILAASYAVSRIRMPVDGSLHATLSRRWMAIVRTIIPMFYVMIVGIVSSVASPRLTGLVSMFPSMSIVLLVVTHLEEGPAPACRIARALPSANLSTVAFFAAFRLGSPALGLACGTVLGYLAALINLAAIELVPRSISVRRLVSCLIRRVEPWLTPTTPMSRPFGHGSRTLIRPTPRHVDRIRPPHRRHFAPRVEILPC